MRSKLSVVLFTAVLVTVFLSASIVYGADAKNPRTTFKLDRAPKFMIPFERGPANMTIVEPIPLNTQNQKRLAPSPGNLAGNTTYDYQHNGSMGRMLSSDLIWNMMFFVWMAQTDFTIPGARHIRGQMIDLATGAPQLGSSGDPLITDYSGYTSCAAKPDAVFGGSSLAAHTTGSSSGSDPFYTRYVYDGSVCIGIPPVPIWSEENLSYHAGDGEFIWPIVTTHMKDEGDGLPAEDVVYILTHEGPDDPGDSMVVFRRVGSICDDAIHFDTGQWVEVCANLAYIVIADPTSNDVAIVYTDDRSGLTEGEGGQQDVDVYYILSTNQGQSWGSPINVSNYTEDSLWRAYTDLSAIYTEDGTLHIVWNARELQNSNTFEDFKCRLVHWDDQTQKTTIIDEARYDVIQYAGTGAEVICDAGAWNMYIAKMSLSECDGKMYALYTKFGDDNEPGALNDCSDGYFANGELYLAGSDDGGATWDTAWNITNTRTPLCDSCLCSSEHWSSMALYGIPYGDGAVPDTLDISYILDYDAGGIPQGEGAWCVNDVMHYRFPCRPVAHIPRPSYEPNRFGDPLHTDPGQPVAVEMKILNIGNEVLSIDGIGASYSDGANWISFGALSQNPIPLGDFATVTVTFNHDGSLVTDPSGWDATIDVDHNGPSDVDHLPVHLTVASDFNMPQNDTLRATTKKLMVYNTGRLGGDNDGAGLGIPGDCDESQTTPNADLYLYDASPMIAWNDGGLNTIYTTVFSQIFTQQGTFRPQSDLLLESFPADGYNKMTCTLSTADSTFGVGVQMWAPTDGNDFMIVRYDFTTWKPGLKGMNQVRVGMFLDWDTPSDENVRNASGYNETLNLVWQRGAELDATDEDQGCAITEDQRYGGVAFIGEAFENAWTGENAPVQQGSGLHPDSIYNFMFNYTDYNMYDTSGQEEDTVIDLHTGMTFAEVDMTAKKTYSYWAILATTNNGLAPLEAQIVAANAWAIEKEILGGPCDCVPGNTSLENLDINVGDAVYIINYVFKGGPAPTPYAICSGDPNGSCDVNVGDAVYLINYIFKGGPAPVSCEVWRDGDGDPNPPGSEFGCGAPAK